MAAFEFQATVKKQKYVTPTVFELYFELDKPLEFLAGHFCSIVIPGAAKNGRDLRRAYSIASPPGRNPIELCIKLVPGGPGTTYLNQLKSGDSFKIFAPYGAFLFKTPPERDVVFIATGTGVSPFRAMVQSPEYRKSPARRAIFVFGVRHEEELLYDSELRDLGPKVLWNPCVSRPKEKWAGYKGRVTDYLRDHSAEFDWGMSDFYLCGNGGDD